MSLEGTWANHVIIQAVADAMNLKIHIIESDSNFREVTLVEPANTTINIATHLHRAYRSNALCLNMSNCTSAKFKQY